MYSVEVSYDSGVYLNLLLIRARILNPIFQSEVSRAVKDIQRTLGKHTTLQFRSGPLKAYQRYAVYIYVN